MNLKNLLFERLVHCSLKLNSHMLLHG